MRKRLCTETKKLLTLLLIGITYFFIVTLFNVSIPCIFHITTGLLCPACGITRMILAMIRFDFVTAYLCNKLLFLTWPLIIFLIFYSKYQYVRFGNRSLSPFTFLAWFEITLLIFFGIARNLI